MVLLSALLLWTQGLNPGIDLAGGTTLTYSVQVPPSADSRTAIEDTIAILKDRVDPRGIRNLVWRGEAGNRLTVQMAQAPPVVGERRQALEQAKRDLLEGNLSERDLEAALSRSGAERDEAVAALAAAHPAQAEALEGLSTLAADRDAARAAYEAAESDPDRGQDAVDAAAVRLLDARDAYRAARDALLAETITPAELERTLALPRDAGRGEAESPRAAALRALKAAAPERSEAVDAVAAASDAYDEVKGPLDDPNDLIRLLRGQGVLEFRIAATSGERPADVERYRTLLAESGTRGGRGEPWRWFPLKDPLSFVDSRNDRAAREAIKADPSRTTAILQASRPGYVFAEYDGEPYMLLANSRGLAMTGDDEWALASAGVGQDPNGAPAVVFNLDVAGAGLLRQMTAPNIGRPMAVLLDGRVYTAPNINDALGRGGVQITGSFNNDEAQALAKTLRAGSLAATLSYDPISIKSTGPQLGRDNLEAGIRASVVALLIVAVFMIVYYFFAGLVAVVALAVTMISILGIMAMLDATFTLPGIAGLVLTIGMAVDANVLIFERIREERVRGVEFPVAVREGFSKAFSSILDANVTSLLTCVVLYYTATSEIKGFALVLGIGILSTLFATLFGSRVLFELAVVYLKPQRMTVLPDKVPVLRRLLEPNIDWFALRRFFLPFSAAVIVLGGIVLVSRGAEVLDIEFRSGTEVVVEFAEGKSMELPEARQRLEAYAEDQAASGDDSVDWLKLENASVVNTKDPVTGATTGFTIATLVSDAEAVSEAVKTAFADVLDTTSAISFADAGRSVGEAAGRVEPIDAGQLSEVIDDPTVQVDTRAYTGGVALVLEGLEPAASVADVTDRIMRMRRQPDFAELGFRDFEVIGLDRGGVNADGEPAFSRMVVLASDGLTDYAADRTGFDAADGLAATEWKLVQDALATDSSLASVTKFDSQVSGTMQQQALAAMVLSILVVIAYIALRFGSFRYGLAAIVALVHDVAAAVGLLAICGWLYGQSWAQAFLLDDFKINLAIVAAILTLIGYSLNDTIIIFDRIRENKGRLPEPTPQIVNDSINQTISRTVLTSGTTLLAVGILYLLGGPGVHGFAFAMLIGVFVGTYSSFAIAAPLLLVGGGKAKKPSPAAAGRPATA
ncbi:putative protein-export membrane protein SecD/SecF [Phycisphaera mikurensis NBRC 102666]|uniref:Multifunctional fusion protein n=1 Tax=Phycisphaera mikurensis (strain NBRC 102666 / KCTC 22515 / FYK2301M01) TaxID=1142394 RepID=I0IGY4_PHYMF|nr:putative protein-export membrane protein SecD/SecF [Phycisphaera mikurensis NBRC 102666]